MPAHRRQASISQIHACLHTLHAGALVWKDRRAKRTRRSQVRVPRIQPSLPPPAEVPWSARTAPQVSSLSRLAWDPQTAHPSAVKFCFLGLEAPSVTGQSRHPGPYPVPSRQDVRVLCQARCAPALGPLRPIPGFGPPPYACEPVPHRFAGPAAHLSPERQPGKGRGTLLSPWVACTCAGTLTTGSATESAESTSPQNTAAEEDT